MSDGKTRQKRMHPALRKFRAAVRKLDLEMLTDKSHDKLRHLFNDSWVPMKRGFFDEHTELEAFNFVIQQSRLGNGKLDRTVVSCNGIKITGDDDAQGTMHILFYSAADNWLRQFAEYEGLVIRFGADVLVEVSRIGETIQRLYAPNEAA